IWRQLEWAGLRRGDRRAWLRGDLVVPADAAGPPFWRMNHAENMLMLSSYHLAESNVPAYIAAMERFDPIVIQAYPSSIAFLAKWLDAAGRTYGGTALKGI
ncbi:MAG: phenylacetate--CoA ligase family protein, partial [Burkholderiaceae bacterium]|nr:phenylacetate--CoA ligase family protein [Burkholderiaceae bacterium]